MVQPNGIWQMHISIFTVCVFGDVEQCDYNARTSISFIRCSETSTRERFNKELTNYFVLSNIAAQVSIQLDVHGESQSAMNDHSLFILPCVL